VICSDQLQCEIISCNPMRGHCEATDIGCSTDLSINTTHCGECGRNCNTLRNVERVSCLNGTCLIEGCHHGYKDCNGDPEDGCEAQLRSSISNCGECGTNCLSLNHTDSNRIECSNGVCNINSACVEGYADCDLNFENGCETTLMNTTQNCGNCAVNCLSLLENVNVNMQSIECQSGTCTFSNCLDEFSNCNQQEIDGCEVNLMINTTHCGSCDTNCLNLPNLKSSQCENGKCYIQSCANSFSDCNEIVDDGCEASLFSVTTCGSCNNNCSSLNNVIEVRCEDEGICAISECKQFTADCNQRASDGCETLLLFDYNHCGGCSRNCQLLPNVTITDCNEGECIILECNSGFADCNQNSEDGCETVLSSLPQNCGYCGMCGNDVIPPTSRSATCQINNENVFECVIQDCIEGFEDCNHISTDGCETITSQIPPECGRCSVNCPPNQENPQNYDDNNEGYEYAVPGPGSLNPDDSINSPTNNNQLQQDIPQHVLEDYFPADVNNGDKVAFNGYVFVVYNPNDLTGNSDSIQLETISDPLRAPDNTKMISSAADITIAGQQYNSASKSTKLKDSIKICFLINETLSGKSKDETCLAYIDVKTNTWKCEDHCLKYSSPPSNNNETWACGYTDHLTDFTVLFGGLAKDGNDGCGKFHGDYILGNLEDDTILIGSVAAAVVFIAIIIIILYVATPLETYLRGKEGARIQHLRTRASRIPRGPEETTIESETV